MVTFIKITETECVEKHAPIENDKFINTVR